MDYFKGAQRDTVVVLDAVSRSYPLIHPDGALTRVLGDDVKKTIAEERRLFYVALTRAVKMLIIVTRSDPEPTADDYKSVSPFLEELRKHTYIPELKWSRYPPLEDLTARIVVRVGNSDRRKKTKDISTLLGKKGDGYTWKAQQEVWYKSLPADGFSPRVHLERSPWVSKADGVTVRFYNDRDALMAAYTVVNGKLLEQ